MTSPWRLFWLSVGLGPLIGLAIVLAVGLVADLFRGTWGGSSLLILGLPFVHIIGAVPAAISALLNIAVGKVARSRGMRLLAAPFCGAVSGLVYVPLSADMHQRGWFIVVMMVICALSSLACMAIHERNGNPATPTLGGTL